MPRMVFKNKTKKQLDKIFKAEELLEEAGVSFDTGYGFGERVWELDYSLEGASCS